MYYNIKVKSKDSQFCLESNEKSVIQREMDLYFAHIFNVSENFKSQIKKIEITNTNLKSINDIDIQNVPLNIQNNTQTIQENIQPIEEIGNLREQKIELEPIIPTPQPTQEMERELQELAQQMPSIEKIIETMQQTPSDIPVIQNQQNSPASIKDIDFEAHKIELTPLGITEISRVSEEPIKQTLPNQDEFISNASNNDALVFENIQETKFEPTQKPEEIDEIIALAQEQINAIDISQDDAYDKESINLISDKNDINQPIDIKNVEIEPFYKENTPAIQEASEQELEKVPTITPISEMKIEIKPSTTNFEEVNQNKINDIFSQETPVKPSIQNEVKNIDNTNTTTIITDENIEQILQEPPVVQPVIQQVQEPEAVIQIQSNQQVQPIQPVQSQENSQPQEINFATFISKVKNINTITDEFLTCSFYIKNMLGQENFTMKFINSKLFQATGKIASTSIADELIAKGYLNVINDSESKKYSITPAGEQYFVATYQG